MNGLEAGLAAAIALLTLGCVALLEPGLLLDKISGPRAVRYVYNRRVGWRLVQRFLPRVEADW